MEKYFDEPSQAGYIKGVSGEIPGTAIEVSDEQYIELISYLKKGYVKDLYLVVPVAYWEKDGTEKQTSYAVQDVPDGCITTPPPSAYHETHNGVSWTWNEEDHKKARREEAEVLYLTKCQTPLIYDSKSFQVCSDSQSDISNMSNYAKLSVDDAVNFPWDSSDQGKWRLTDNTYYTFETAPDFLDFAKAVMAYVGAGGSGLRGKLFDHKDSIDACSTYEQVRDYDITTGW